MDQPHVGFRMVTKAWGSVSIPTHAKATPSMPLPKPDEASLLADSGTVFLADRVDGFGARLSAMVDAAWLAMSFGRGFKFSWRPFGVSDDANVITPSEQVFAPAFLERHHIDRRALRGKVVRILRDVQRNVPDAIRENSGIDAIRIDWRPFARQAPDLAPAIGTAGRRAAFEAIGFAPALEQARVLAAAVDMPAASVAIHLRAGDIVYGRFRAFGTLHAKVLPYPLFFELLRRKSAEGVQVFLFGQDRALLDHARDAHGVRVVQDMTSGLGFSDLQQALFEISLMSRCGEICAGNSAFSITASKIAGITIQEPSSLFSGKETSRLIEAALAGWTPDDPASPLQAAMAAWHGAIARKYEFGDPHCLAFMEEAIRHDPANPFYRAVRAAAHYDAGQHDAAEAQLSAALNPETLQSALVEEMILTLPKTPVLSQPRILQLLRAMAESGRPGAALLLALRARILNDADDYASLRALFLHHRQEGAPTDPEAFFNKAP